MFKRRLRGRRFEAIQIEVTSRCNLRCVMCPISILADRWPALDLPWETFQRIARAFEHTKWVHLQGWGEPLLHPRLFDMITLAKIAGCLVGFTTNGTLLTTRAAEQLLDVDLDLLAVSVASARPGTHEAIRVGSSLQALIKNLQGLLALRAQRAKERPRVVILFLMTRSNLAELPGVVELASSLGVDELVATNLDCVLTPQLDDLKMFASSPAAQAYEDAMDRARALARRSGLVLRTYPLEPRGLSVCELNPLKILFVSADGSVSPCTYTAVAGQPEIPRVFEGKTLRIPPVRFGNVKDQELMGIWESPAYRAFRRQFAERIQRTSEYGTILVEACTVCRFLALRLLRRLRA